MSRSLRRVDKHISEANFTTPRHPSPTPTAIGRPQTQRERDLHDAIASLEYQRDNLQDKIYHLESRLAACKAEKQTVEAHCSYVEQLNRELGQDWDAAETRVQLLETENTRIRVELATECADKDRLQQRVVMLVSQDEERRRRAEAKHETDFMRTVRMKEEKRRSVARMMGIRFGETAEVDAEVRKRKDRRMEDLYDSVRAAILLCGSRKGRFTTHAEVVSGRAKDLEEELRMIGDAWE